MTREQLDQSISKAQEKVAEFAGSHAEYCEIRDGFNCDCGLEDAQRHLDHLIHCRDWWEQRGTNPFGE